MAPYEAFSVPEQVDLQLQIYLDASSSVTFFPQVFNDLKDDWANAFGALTNDDLDNFSSVKEPIPPRILLLKRSKREPAPIIRPLIVSIPDPISILPLSQNFG